jgi:beta-galactosidase
MHFADSKHILLNGIKISTLSANPAVIQVRIKTSCAGEVSIAIFDQSSLVASASQLTEGKTFISLSIPNAKLWDDHAPYLYVCKASFCFDQ